MTVAIMLMSETMFFVQQSGYKIKSIFSHLWLKIKDNFLNIFMCLVIILSMFFLDLKSIYFIIPYVITQTSLWLWAGNQFEYLPKLKLTKRLIRQLFLMLILIVFSLIILAYINYYYISLLFPFIFLYLYILLFFTIVILQPIEKLIAKYFLNNAKKKLRSNPKLIKIGITGSYGKTSTKEILKSILSQEFYVLATPKSFNTPMGISKTINEKLQNSHQIFLCEMGAKKIGEINELCVIVGVDYGIVTSVGRQHLETFGNIGNVYKTKKELPDYLYQKHCVFNLMNYYVNQMFNEYLYDKIGIFILPKRLGKMNINSKIFSRKHIKCMKNFSKRYLKFYEFIKSGNVYAKNIKATSLQSQFDIYYNNEFLCTAKTELIGIHNIINILLSTALSVMLKVKPKNIAMGIGGVKSIKARFEKMSNDNGATVINNGYNSNLDSAVCSLKALSLFENKNKLVITPGLIECKDMYEDNYKLGKLVGKYASEVIVVKKLNRDAIIEGLKSVGFRKSKIYAVDDFATAKKVIDKLPNDYVVLIENDLPENFK